MDAAAAPPVTDPNLGRVLADNYRIDALLDAGGMGSVYSGVQLSVNRPVAVKLIASNVERSAEHLARFRREAEAMAKLRHPNTVRLFDFGVTEQGQLFMVMELLRGRDLAHYLAQMRRLSLAQALGVVRQIAQSLAEAHAQGIVHRDLKPGNIFLSRVDGGEGFVKVMDFGIAGTDQSDDRTQLTKTGAIVGTPAYMSPEQAQGLVVDGRADLYSLGLLLFEALAGRPPFDATSAVSLLIAQVTHTPPPIAEVCPEIPEPESVQSLLDRLLAKNPDERFASANDLIAAVDELLPKVGPARSSDIPALPASFANTEPSGTTLGAGRKVKRRVWPFGVAALSLAVCALLSWIAWHQLSAPAASIALTYVTIASVPSGASVRMAGAELGRTPYELRLKRATTIEVSLPAHEPRVVTIAPDGEPNVVVQLTPLPPLAERAAARARGKNAMH